MAGQLDKAQEIASLSATVTVKEIFAGVDIERRAGFLMQGTQANELLCSTGVTGSPVVPLQVFQQRKALFEPLKILAQRQCSFQCRA
jgi:hypothetical protein